MKLSLHTIALPLKHAFRTAHGKATVQESVIVELEEDGLRGYGEGTAPSYYGVTARSMCDALEAARTQIESERLDDPAALWDRLAPKLMHNRFAQAALDEAACDLWGKKLGRPVYQLWGLDLRDIPVSDYTIGIDTIQRMAAKMAEYADWPIFKIKLGTPNDLEIVRQLRRRTSGVFRVDANGGWTADEAIRNAGELKKLGVEFIEQPLAADDWTGMRRLFAESELPLVADESCQTEGDVPRCRESFHGINIKLGKCGGMTPARRMIERARALGMKVMMGCMTESTVGISAVAQFLPLLDYVDMDGAELIAADVAEGVRLDRGRAVFPNENGNGVRLLPRADRLSP